MYPNFELCIYMKGNMFFLFLHTIQKATSLTSQNYTFFQLLEHYAWERNQQILFTSIGG